MLDAPLFDHQRDSRVHGTPQYVAVRGSLGEVIECFCPGILHALVARVPARIRLLSNGADGADVADGSNGVPPDWSVNEEFSNDAKIDKTAVVDMCLYVGQSVEVVIREFACSVTLVTPEDDLATEARRILGDRVRPDGFIPPWKTFYGDAWQPKPAVEVEDDGELPGVVDIDIAELTGPEFLSADGVFHTLPPRHGSGGDAGVSPDSPLGYRLGRGTMAAQVTMPEDEEVLGGVPTEPVRTGWSSRLFIQPAGFSVRDLTVFSRGMYGDNVAHLMLDARAGVVGRDNHAVIRYLVDLFGPKFVLTPKQKRLMLSEGSSLYEGKTALHHSILTHDAKLVQFLVERGANVRARCTGSFFGATSHAYYGEFPLSFAVCTGQKEVARFLVENGARVNEDHDSNFSYALHMSINADRIAMYDFLEDEMGADPTLQNIRGETPLELAARLNRKELFYHIIFKNRDICWQYGSRVNYNLDLRVVDGVTMSEVCANSSSASALETIVANDYINMLNSPPIIQLLHAKWVRGARGHYFGQLFLFCTGLVLQALLCQHQWQTLASVIAGDPVVSVLKIVLQTAAHCQPPFVETLNNVLLTSNDTQTPLLGYGAYTCDNTSCLPPALEVLDSSSTAGTTQILGYGPYNCVNGFIVGGTTTDLETSALECGTFAVAVLLLCLELWDIAVFLYTTVTRKFHLDNMQAHAPSLPLIYPIPGGVILDQHRRARVVEQRKKLAFNNTFKHTFHNKNFTVQAVKHSVPLWLQALPHLLGNALNALLMDYISLQPTVCLVWIFIALVFDHFIMWHNQTIPENSKGEELSAAAIVGWLYLLHFARGFRFVGHLVVIIFRIISSDIAKWACVYLIIMPGFAISLFIVMNDQFMNQTTTLVDQSFATIPYSLYRLFRHSMGDAAFDVVSLNEGAETFTVVVIVAFTILGTMVMTNLLIAMMNNTFNQIANDALKFWYMQWAHVIIHMERRSGRRSLGQLALGSLWQPSVRELTDVEIERRNEHGNVAKYDNLPPALQYAIVNVEDTVMGQEDINSGSKDALELNARDRLRRNVTWMQGGASLALPTISEIEKLMEKMVGTIKANLGDDADDFVLPPVRAAARPVLARHGSFSSTRRGSTHSIARTAVSCMSSATHVSAVDVRVEARSCSQCGPIDAAAVPDGAMWSCPTSACALFVPDVRLLVGVRRANAPDATSVGNLARMLQNGSPMGSVAATASFASVDKPPNVQRIVSHPPMRQASDLMRGTFAPLVLASNEPPPSAVPKGAMYQVHPGPERRALGDAPVAPLFELNPHPPKVSSPQLQFRTLRPPSPLLSEEDA